MLTIKPQDVAALIEAFERSSSQEMCLAADNFELHLSKNAARIRQSWQPRDRPPATSAESDVVTAQPPEQVRPVPASVASEQTDKAVAASPPAGHVYVKAPNLGTFYRSPKPGAPAYVEVGTQVGPETEVCLIEVMKLFTPVVAGVQGIVREILVDDSALVEFDQPLFLVQIES